MLMDVGYEMAVPPVSLHTSTTSWTINVTTTAAVNCARLFPYCRPAKS